MNDSVPRDDKIEDDEQKFSDFSVETILGVDFEKSSQAYCTFCPCDAEAKCRKQRTIYRMYQTKILEEAFRKQQYVVGVDREILADQLQLSEAQVRIWFQNRRSKWRKVMRKKINN